MTKKQFPSKPIPRMTTEAHSGLYEVIGSQSQTLALKVQTASSRLSNARAPKDLEYSNLFFNYASWYLSNDALYRVTIYDFFKFWSSGDNESPTKKLLFLHLNTDACFNPISTCILFFDKTL